MCLHLCRDLSLPVKIQCFILEQSGGLTPPPTSWINLLKLMGRMCSKLTRMPAEGGEADCVFPLVMLGAQTHSKLMDSVTQISLFSDLPHLPAFDFCLPNCPVSLKTLFVFKLLSPSPVALLNPAVTSCPLHTKRFFSHARGHVSRDLQSH